MGGGRGGGGGGWVGFGGVRMDVNEKLKFLWKFKKKIGGGGSGGSRGGKAREGLGWGSVWM